MTDQTGLTRVTFIGGIDLDLAGDLDAVADQLSPGQQAENGYNAVTDLGGQTLYVNREQVLYLKLAPARQTRSEQAPNDVGA
jgi:hypothetical protein